MIYFFVFYGTYGITYSKAKGEFECPQCQAVQSYRHRRVRRFFHVFFIPLVPLDVSNEYVECDRCRGTYKLEVLDGRRLLGDGAVSEQIYATRRLLVLVMLADGRVDEVAISSIRGFLAMLDHRQVPREEIMAEVEAAQRDPGDVEAFCRTLTSQLDAAARDTVMRGARSVAGAHGRITTSAQALLDRVAVELGLKAPPPARP